MQLSPLPDHEQLTNIASVTALVHTASFTRSLPCSLKVRPPLLLYLTMRRVMKTHTGKAFLDLNIQCRHTFAFSFSLV
jgi:hypothetical protein